MNKIIPVLALILISEIAYAEPIYLNCTFPDNPDGYRDLSVTLDETIVKASVAWKNHSDTSYVADANYSANSITFQAPKKISGCNTSTTSISIDRATLLLNESMRMVCDAIGDDKTFVRSVQCIKVEAAKNNKI